MRISTLLRSVAAILAGIIAGAVLSIGTDSILEATGVFPPLADQMNGGVQLTTAQFLLATFYRTVYTVFSCWLGAVIAPKHKMRFAIALGIIAFIANLAGLILMPDPGPAWYPIALAVLALPSGWIGGKLATRKA